MNRREPSVTPRTSRSVRDPFTGTFDRLTPDRPYADQPDVPEEEDGETLNDFVPSQPFKPISSSPSFTEEDVESGSESESHWNTANDYVGFSTVLLGDGIEMKVPTEFEASFNSLFAIKWTSKEKNQELVIPNNLSNIKYLSDIFKLRIRGSKHTSNGNLQQITNPTEKKLPRSKQCILALQDKFENEILFRVPLDDKFANYRNSDVTCYKAVIECGGNQWKTIPATLTDGRYIEFKCIRFNSFGLASTTRIINGVVEPSGKLLSTGDHGRLDVNFEKGCVTTKQNYQYSIQRPDPEYVKKPKSIVVAVSDKLCLDFDSTQFKKPISMVASLSNIEENGSDEYFEIKVIIYREDKPEVINTKIEQTSDNRYKMILDKPSRVLIAALRRDTDFQAVEVDLKNELDLFFGYRKMCKISLFFNTRCGKAYNFIADCSAKENHEAVVKYHEGKGRSMVFESEDILLPPQQRVRIRPSGCIGAPAGARANYFLFFLYATRENFCEFSVEVSRAMGASVNAIVEFSADNQTKGNVTKADFDMDFIFKSNPRLKLHRGHAIAKQNRPGIYRMETFIT